MDAVEEHGDEPRDLERAPAEDAPRAPALRGGDRLAPERVAPGGREEQVRGHREQRAQEHEAVGALRHDERDVVRRDEPER